MIPLGSTRHHYRVCCLGIQNGQKIAYTNIVMPQTKELIDITPNAERLAIWFCEALANHAFCKGAKEPVREAIKAVRALDDGAVSRLLKRLS